MIHKPLERPLVTLSNRFVEAFSLAASLHTSQVRKATEIPYISHLMAVCALVLEHGGDEDEAIAALLHDALEDQADSHPGGAAGLRKTIDEHFGVKVTAIVNGCTDTDVHPKPTPWHARKKAYISRLATATPPVLRVSAADKLHNARCILSDYRQLGEKVWNRFHADRTKILWYYQALVTAYQKTQVPASLLAELEYTVAEIKRLADLATS